MALQWPRPELYDRINRRVDNMMNAGQLEEARKLYPQRQLSALQTVGYQELFDYFDGKVSREEAIQLIKQNTRRYAKRQLTWKRRDGFWKHFRRHEFEFSLDYLVAAMRQGLEWDERDLPTSKKREVRKQLLLLSRHVPIAQVTLLLHKTEAMIYDLVIEREEVSMVRFLLHEAILRAEDRTVWGVLPKLPSTILRDLGLRSNALEDLPASLKSAFMNLEIGDEQGLFEFIESDNVLN